MPFIAVPNIAQFNVRATINTIPIENVLHFVKEFPAPWDASDLALGINALLPAWDTNMLAVLTAGYAAQSIYARDLSEEMGPVAEAAFLAGSVGTAAGETLPGNVAACITHRTGLAGRSARGRTYIGGIGELSVTGNLMVAGFATALIDAWQATIDDMTAAGYSLVVASRYHNKLPRNPGIYNIVQSSVLRDLSVDSQRRRLT